MRRIEEGTSAVLLQSGLDKKWWAGFHEMLLPSAKRSRKTSDGRRFGEPFRAPAIPFGSMIEYHPISAKGRPRLHHFGKKVLPENLPGYALYAERIWKGHNLVADIEELEFWTRHKSMLGDSMQRKSSCRRMVNIAHSRSQMEQLNCLEEIRFCSRRSVGAHPSQKWRTLQTLLQIPKSECPDIGMRLPRHKWPTSWSNIEDPVVPLSKFLWERQFEKSSIGTGMGKSTEPGMRVRASKTRSG